jgi:hypothetical protein
MTDGVPNIVPAIGGLVGIGIMAGVANQVVKQVGEQANPNVKKKKRNPNYVPNPYGQTSFSSNMEDRIKRMI